MIVALRRADGSVRRDPEARRRPRRRATCSSASGRRRRSGGSRSCSRRARRRLPDARRAASPRALAEVAGAPVELERPGGRRARRLRDERRAPARAGAGGGLRASSPRRSPRRPSSAGSSSAPSRPGPGFVNLRAGRRLARARRSAEILDAGDVLRWRAPPPTPERIQVEMVSANPTGPITVASARERRLRRLASRACSRFAGHDGRARVLLQRRRRADGPLPRVGRGACGAARSRPRTATTASTSPSSPRLPGDPVPAMLERIEATLERFRIHFDTWERQSEVEAEIPEAIALLDTFEEDGALWARTSALRRRQGPRARPLRRDADVLRGRRRVHPPASSRAASTGSSTSSAPTTTATSRACRRSREMLGHPRESRRGAHLPARPPRRGRRGDEDVEAARRRRLPRRASWTRSASTRPAGTSSPAATTRRSRSTSTSRARRRRRTPSTTSSTRTPGSPGSSATPRSVAPSREAQPRAARGRGARAREAARSSSRRSSPRPTERRAPHAIPTYAIRVADDFHRFYHHHRVLESEQRGVPARSLRGRRRSSSRAASICRGRGARTDVGSEAT